MEQLAHGRQTGLNLDQIRADHRYRYEWAAQRLKPGSIVLDAGCGIGYGSLILARAGHRVLGIDADRGAVEIAQRHYKHPHNTFCRMRIEDAVLYLDKNFAAVVCFEVLEHLPNDMEAAYDLGQLSGRLLCSVPNEAEYPFEETRPLGHLRHYTEDQFEKLLDEWADGISSVECFHQEGKFSRVALGWTGRTLIADAQK